MDLKEIEEKINEEDTRILGLIELCHKLESYAVHTHDCRSRAPLNECYCGLKDSRNLLTKTDLNYG